MMYFLRRFLGQNRGRQMQRGLAEPLASLGRFIRSRKNFLTMPPHFFFDFFVAVDEGWSAMVMRSRLTSRHL